MSERYSNDTTRFELSETEASRIARYGERRHYRHGERLFAPTMTRRDGLGRRSADFAFDWHAAMSAGY
jgi:hypothetical protein